MKKEIWFNFNEVIFIDSYDDHCSNPTLVNSMFVILSKKDYQFRIPLKYCIYKQNGNFVWSILEDKKYFVYNSNTKNKEELLGKEITDMFIVKNNKKKGD